MTNTETDIKYYFNQISIGDISSFNVLFRNRYESLVWFAQSFINETGQAEDIVSDVFVWLWSNRESLSKIDNPEVYLFSAVKNKCINVLRNSIKAVSIDKYYEKENDFHDNPLSEIEQKELIAKLHTIVESLPEQQRVIFKMIKENGLTAKQVAEILNLSSRTVETHIYKALQRLEKEITEYLGYSPKRKTMNRLIFLAL